MKYPKYVPEFIKHIFWGKLVIVYSISVGDLNNNEMINHFLNETRLIPFEEQLKTIKRM